MVWAFHGTHTIYGWNDPESFIFFVELSHPTIMVQCLSTSAKPHWKLGGYVSRVLSEELIPESQEHRVFLGQKTLIHFLPIAEFPLYRVRFRLPKWIEQMAVTLWEYQ